MANSLTVLNYLAPVSKNNLSKMFSNRVNLTLKALLVQTVKGGGPEVEEVFFSDFSPHLPGVFFEHGVIIKASFCLIHIVKYDKISHSLV